MASADSPAGAKRPNQVLMSKDLRPSAAPASATVGTSGMALDRAAVVTASALSLPLLMLADAAARLSKLKSTCPPTSASCAGGPPA